MTIAEAPETKQADTSMPAQPGAGSAQLGAGSAEPGAGSAQLGAVSAESAAVHAHQPFSVRRKVRSLFMLSLAIFAVMNAAFSFTKPFPFDPYKFSYRGWAWWMMNDMRHDMHEHNVAVMGSSIMCSAVAGCDANFLNQKLDMTKYHRVAYLDKLLQSTYGGKFNTFNLAAPGQMPSDAYLYLKAMSETANRPEVVIYGIAPRDFIDSTLQGANDTEPFKYLTRIVNVDNVADAAFRTVWSKLDWYLQKLVFMYGYSLDFRLAVADAAENGINRLIPLPTGARPFTWWDRARILPKYLPGEIHPEAMICSPLTKDKLTFSDNTQEYKYRYKDPDPETFHTQMYFLRKLAEYCQRERIELVLVNMPITRWNASLLPPGKYNSYLDSMRQFSWNHSVTFYDLCDFARYPNADFHDSVHLNAFGGTKFFDDLMVQLKKDYRASTMFEMAGTQLEKRIQLARQENSDSRKVDLNKTY